MTTFKISNHTVDICILSNAKSLKHYWMTQEAINSILKSSDNIQFNIFVMETASIMPDGTEPKKKWVEDKCYGVQAENGIFRVDGQPYTAPNNYTGFVWIEERQKEILARIGANYEAYTKKEYTAVPKKNIEYAGAITYKAPEPFNYNQCINFVLNHGSWSEWLCVMNNDTITYPGAFDKMLATGYDSVSPHSKVNAPGQAGAVGVEEGYQICRHIAGWCILTKKEVFKKLRGGKMDERFFYFHQDVDYAHQLHGLGIKHALCMDARIDHLQCQSHPETPTEQAWSLESTRLFYNTYPEDYGVWTTGIHTGRWTKEQIFDKEWVKEFKKKYPKEKTGRKKKKETAEETKINCINYLSNNFDNRIIKF